jgi:protein-tyrosine-phosphatase
MAEGFARHYGRDVVTAESAGLEPAGVVVTETIRTMAEKNIDITQQYSKPLPSTSRYDLIVNLSGFELPDPIEIPVLIWKVRDPIGQPDSVYREVRDEIENLVMDLVQNLRRARDVTTRRLA